MSRSKDELEEERAARIFLLLHGATGAAFGALVGFFVWMRWDWRLRQFFQSHSLDSWTGFAFVVGGIALLFGLLACCLKERFWEDWRTPFRW
jgi:hypothetical protein